MVINTLSKFSHYWILGAIIVISAVSAIIYVAVNVPPLPRKTAAQGSSLTGTSNSSGNANSASPTITEPAPQPQPSYHKVTATRFWVGEVADESNAYIPNHESAWVGDWLGEFGGVDDPENRCGYNPCKFTPKQNAFYVALPFNDIDANGKPKTADILSKIPWYTGTQAANASLMKNHWVEIKYGKKVAYGQIEDVGPMNEDDADYVFGTAAPKFKAGIDLSPALTDYLGTNGYATVQWRFVDESTVISGPWLEKVTRSQINY